MNSKRAFEVAFESGFGVELDVRDYNSQLVVSHDPARNNNDHLLLSKVFKLYKHKSSFSHYIAINIKSDGLIDELKKQINSYEIIKYFTFDMSVPELLRYRNTCMNYFTRISEFEPNPNMLDDAAGIWLDAFESEWYDADYIQCLLKTGKQVCIVSSELHGRDHTHQWALIKGLNDQNNLMLCTDKPNRAKEYFK